MIIARETAPGGANETMFDGRSSTEGTNIWRTYDALPLV